MKIIEKTYNDKLLFMSIGANPDVYLINEYLQNKRRIKSKIESFIGNKEIIVSEKDYYKALTYGSLFIVKNNIENIEWIYNNSERMKNIEDVAKMASFRLGDKRILTMVDVNKLQKGNYALGSSKRYNFEDIDI